MKHLQNPQEQIFTFIVSYCNNNGIPPTVREIGAAVGLKSTSAVHYHLKKMEENGLILRNPMKQRSIVVAGQNTSRMVPLVGHVAAGSPILAIENIQDQLALPNNLLRGASDNEAFMLKVEGDSMVDIGMYDGDYILVHNALQVNNSDIVVARISNENFTVKRYFDEGARIRLQPENTAMQPIYVEKGDIVIVGKVIGLVREYS